MKAKNVLIAAAVLTALAAPSAALADYTDYVPGVGVVKVSYVSGSGENIVLNVTAPNGKVYAVSGYIDENGRGAPDPGALEQASNNSALSVRAPAGSQTSASVVDSSERRTERFLADNPDVSNSELLIGYPSGNLAVDSAASARETATVALRAKGEAAGREAWDQTEGMNTDQPVTLEEANALMEGTGYTVADLNGDGIIQRGELFNAVSSYIAVSTPDETIPSVPTTPSNPSIIPGLGDSSSSMEPSCSFTSDKGSILVNQRATLIWSCSNVSSCSIDQEIGSVNPVGEREVAPAKSVTYTLNCSGGSGSRTLATTVNVYEVFIEEVPSD